MRVSPVAGLRRPTLRRTRQPGLIRRGTTIGMERTPARSPDGRLGADHLTVHRGVSAAGFTRARSTPTESERRTRIPQVENLRPLRKTPGHYSGGTELKPKLQKTPPRTAPSWMPPAVSRLRHILPVTGSSAPGAGDKSQRAKATVPGDAGRASNRRRQGRRGP